ncbi:hypothetical protein KY315_00950 [Candidatus Woesearchaeota archaeon]|nr:hypothetical protein [Candidatus Woesearchaeota archaeon]
MLTRLIFYSLLATNSNTLKQDLFYSEDGTFETTCETYAPEQEEVLESVEDKTGDMARDMAALELFLTDQKSHKEFCSDLRWVQPSIDVYKEKIESQLSNECKERIPSSEETPVEEDE